MAQPFRTLIALFAVRLPRRAFNLVFRCDWRPIRFILSLVFIGAAIVQAEFAFSPQMPTLVSGVYVLASATSVIFTAFYLFISTNDEAAYNGSTLKKRSFIELGASLIWFLVAFIDWYAHEHDMITLDAVSWQHHLIINGIVLLTLGCAFFNAFSFATQSELQEKYRTQKSGEENG